MGKAAASGVGFEPGGKMAASNTGVPGFVAWPWLLPMQTPGHSSDSSNS